MQGYGRAVYTRCFTGINFDASVSLQEGQQIFSTSKNMSLPKKTISLIETEIRKDIYNAGMRPYLEDAYRYLNCNGTSVMLHYSWLGHNETGGKEYGLTKALIGDFNSHPMEYCSFNFFTTEKYFFDYLDANGQHINQIRQLHSFRGEAPPQFNVLEQKDLLGVPVIDFEQIGNYVRAYDYTLDRVRAAVCHLVKQFNLPSNQRKGIAYQGEIGQICYLFAAIGYAFSAISARKIPFSIAFPPVGFSYNFSTAALVGWDKEDPDITKLNRMPSNLVQLDHLPEADDSIFSQIISYDKNHRNFIYNYILRNDVDIKDYVDAYHGYVDPHYFERKKEEARKLEAEKARDNEKEESHEEAGVSKKEEKKTRTKADKEAKAKADERARRETEEARKKTEEDARQRDEDETRRRKINEARRIENEELLKKEEARRLAEEQDHKKAEEEALRNNEEESRKKKLAELQRQVDEATRYKEQVARYNEAKAIIEVTVKCIGKLSLTDNCIGAISSVAAAVLRTEKEFVMDEFLEILELSKTKSGKSAFTSFCHAICLDYKNNKSDSTINKILILAANYYEKISRNKNSSNTDILRQSENPVISFTLINAVFTEIKTKHKSKG